MAMRWVLTIGACLGALAIGACGDDDDEEGGPLTKAEFVALGNAICAKQTAEFNKLFETSFPTTPSAMPAFFEKATPIIRTQVDELRALEPPAADKARIDRLVAAGERVVADFEKAAKDRAFGVKLFGEEGGATTKAFEDQAKAYGMTKCEEDEEEDEPKVDTSGFSTEKQAYIAEVDAICKRYNPRFSRLEQRHLQEFPPQLDAWAKFLPAVVELGRAQMRQIRAVEPPAAEKGTVDALITEQEQLFDTFAEAGRLAAAKDEERFVEVSQGMFAAGEDADAKTRAYGFQVCGAEGD
ncbi:MAG TPA: hypothetical protein VFZ89_17385 [Solirubrobacteraceae bacterium]